MKRANDRNHLPTIKCTGGVTGLSASRRPMFGEQQRFVLLLIAPAALLMLLFQVVPIAIGANASFRDWALYNPKKIWVGLAHYQGVITDPAFLYVVLPNTFLFMVLSVAGALVTGLRSEERRVGKECRSRWRGERLDNE